MAAAFCSIPGTWSALPQREVERFVCQHPAEAHAFQGQICSRTEDDVPVVVACCQRCIGAEVDDLYAEHVAALLAQQIDVDEIDPAGVLHVAFAGVPS